jgi:hypothetical protein
MGWNYAILEVHCFFPIGDSEKPKFGPPPYYCKYGPGNSGVHCIVGNKNDQEVSDMPCPYAGYCQAQATVVLTNGDGECIESDSFWSDEDLSAQEWNRLEEKWLEAMRFRIQKMREDSPEFGVVANFMDAY